MDLDSLKSFILMAEVGNLSEAADRLYLSTSSLTGRIKKIEKEIGEELFVLVGRTLNLSPAGKVFLSYAKQFCSLQNDLEQKVSSFKKEKQRFRIAATPSISSYILPELLTSFRACYPEMELKVYSCPSFMIRDYLMKDEIDLGIAQSSNKYEFLNYEHWFSDRDILVVSKDHPWAKKAEIEVDYLKEHPLIAYQRHTILWKERLSWIKEQGVNPRIGMELTHIETIKDILLNNYGYAFLPIHGIKHELEAGKLQEIQLLGSPELRRNTFFVTNKKQQIANIYADFMAFAVEKTKHEFPKEEGKMIS